MKLAYLLLYTIPGVAFLLLLLLGAFWLHWALGLLALIPILLGIGGLCGNYVEANAGSRPEARQ